MKKDSLAPKRSLLPRLNRRVALLVLLSPTLAWAQNMPAMSPEDMQKMMQAANDLSTCMSKVDQKELNKLQQRSMEFDSQAKSLCNQGKGMQAQQLAMEFALELSSNASVKQVMQCGEKVKVAMNGMSLPIPIPDFSQQLNDLSNDVCGAYKMRK